MSRRRGSLAVLVAAGVLLVAGCGSGGASDAERSTTTMAGRGDVPVATWSKQFCAGFDAWLGALDAEMARVGARLSTRDLPEGRRAVADLFVRSGRQTEAFVAELDGLGAPEVGGGIRFATTLRAHVDAFGAAMEDAAARAEKLPARDPAALQLGLADLVNSYESSMNEASRALADLDRSGVDPELRDALVSACGS